MVLVVERLLEEKDSGYNEDNASHSAWFSGRHLKLDLFEELSYNTLCSIPQITYIVECVEKATPS